jgi:Uma2 family endonuclease
VERSSAVRYTYQDLLSLPESPTRRHEILDGKLYVTAAPRVNHQRVVFDLGIMVRALAQEHGLGEVFVGPVTVHVHDEMVFEPDLVFVGSDRMWIVDPEGDIHGVPDLVVEVLSPSTRSYDRNLKRKHYMDSGLPQLWLVDIQQRAVEVWRSGVEEPDVERDAVRWQVGGGSFPLPLEEMLAGI